MPERYGSWQTLYTRFRRWALDGTFSCMLRAIQAEGDAAGDIDWRVPVDSTIVRAHQHAAGARTDPPLSTTSKGGEQVERQAEKSWMSLVARLVEVVQKVRAWAARAAGSPASST